MIALTAIPGTNAQTQPQGKDEKKPASSSQAQTQDTEQEYSYMDQARAVLVMDQLREAVKNDVRRLHVLVANYGTVVPDADKEFESIKTNYKKALELLYTRHYAGGVAKLDACHKQALTMFQKFAVMFKDQTTKILSECSDAMVNFELSSAEAKGSSSSTTVTAHEKNLVKMKVSYGQIAQAEDMMRDNRFDAAIEHYRIAKLFAINFLRMMDTDPSKQKLVEEKYKVDLLDATGGYLKSHK
ncbi:MAG: hypothetical protein HY042_10450 [Spirochaetia bacterium]|nr:hypothetical protein [Spirochaetia bacterium]